MTKETKSSAAEAILRSWLDEPELTLFCGDWRRGGLMELLPRGRALLTGRRYDPPFDGLRELRLDGAGHHVHLDFSRLTAVSYCVAPSVCYGFRPAFEVRFGTGGEEEHGSALGLGITSPYAGQTLRTAAVRRYLRRADEHLRLFPGVVRFSCEPPRIADKALPVWCQLTKLLDEFSHLSDRPLGGLRQSLRRAGASVPAAA